MISHVSKGSRRAIREWTRTLGAELNVVVVSLAVGDQARELVEFLAAFDPQGELDAVGNARARGEPHLEAPLGRVC